MPKEFKSEGGCRGPLKGVNFMIDPSGKMFHAQDKNVAGHRVPFPYDLSRHEARSYTPIH